MIVNSDGLDLNQVEVIFGNSNKRFSGVTSTMLQVLPHISSQIEVAVLGRHHVPAGVPVLTFLQAVARLRKPLVDGRFRVFHARRNDEMIQALILKFCFRSKIKIVFTSTAQRKKTWLTRWLMSQMDGLLSTCDAAAQYMPTPPDRIIPHGINLAFFGKTEDKSQLPIGLPAKYNIGLFGRVRAQKGVDLLIDAVLELFFEFPDWGLVIVGEITEDQKAFYDVQKEKLKRAGFVDRVVFTDKVAFETLPQYFHAVDIGCALSVNEGFGLTVLEAAACGKPVVATRAGAWPDILSNTEAGFLIDVGNKSALVDALRLLMGDPNERLRRGLLAKELVQNHYTVEKEAAALIDYYRTMNVDFTPSK